MPYWLGTRFYISVLKANTMALKANTMAKSSRGRSQDRSKVAGGQDYEVQYEKEKTGASKEQIKKAIKTEGNQRKKVEEKLKKSKQPWTKKEMLKKKVEEF